MSMQCWTIDGYGFDLTSIEFNPHLFADFVRKYNSYEFEELDIDETMSDSEITKRYEEAYISPYNDEEGIGAAIADVMRNKTCICFEYCTSEYGKICVLPCTHVWNYTDFEKTLTEKKMFDICKEFANELGIDERHIGYQSLECFG